MVKGGSFCDSLLNDYVTSEACHFRKWDRKKEKEECDRYERKGKTGKNEIDPINLEWWRVLSWLND